MTLQAVAGFLGQSGIQHPALLYRNFTSAFAGRRSGFYRHDDFVLTPSGSAMSLNVGRGDAFLMGTEGVSTQGGYYCWNNATETLAWPAAAASPRIDSLILRVIDTDYGADPAGSKAVWEIVSGTPAGSPVAVADSAFAPAGLYYHPGAWLRVADFTVGASITNLAAATLSHKRKYCRVGRHCIGLSNDFPTDAVVGDQFTPLDGTYAGVLYIYDGASWQRTSKFDGQASDNNVTTISGITSTTFIPGSPVCGTSFVAPPSGGVWINLSGRITATTNTNEFNLSFEVRSGSSVGAGTIVISASSVRTISAGRAVNASAVAIGAGTRRYRIPPGTLTPGASYNVQTMHACAPAGTGTVEYREVTVEPVIL